MKKELKLKIMWLCDDKNMSKLKDIIAHIHWLDRVDKNRYIMYDREMGLANIDLYYVVSINENWYVEQESEWYGTRSELNDKLWY